jgi:hypothetical protein
MNEALRGHRIAQAGDSETRHHAEDPYKMTTPIAPGVATPDTLETSIGTLNLTDGFLNPDTVEKIYDNLDRSRALQAYLLAIPIVNQAGMRDSLRKFGPDNQTDVIWETLVDPKTIELTANNNTIYLLHPEFVRSNRDAGGGKHRFAIYMNR